MSEPRNIAITSTLSSHKWQAGFSLLELTVVVGIVSSLFLFAYQHYLDLLVDVEKARMEQTIGILRSAIGMKVAKMVVDGKVSKLNRYEGTNPINFLDEVPNNYEGEIADSRNLGERNGLWYFDSADGLLVYRVKNTSEFYSVREEPEARFRLSVVYDGDSNNSFAGLNLHTKEKYSWFKKTF